IIPIASLILLVALSYYLFGDAGAAGPNQLALVVAAMIAVVVARCRGHSLESLREAAVASVGSGLSLALALGFFFMLGRPGDLDASDKMAAIERTFHITPWLFVPLVVVVVLAVLKIPPFTAIFTGALAGGLLAVIVAPGRVVAFAGPGDGL